MKGRRVNKAQKCAQVIYDGPLKRQRKQIYDEIRDSKCRVQQLRRNLLSPSSQFEGSAEKLLVNDIQNFENQNQHFYSSFGSSSGRASPCSTPTPPPYNRNRQNVPGQASISPQVSCFSKVNYNRVLSTKPLEDRILSYFQLEPSLFSTQ